MSVKPDYKYIRNACKFSGRNTDEDIDKLIAEFRVRKIIPEDRFNAFITGQFNVRIKQRYNQFCYCPDGEYKSYASTMIPGHAYAMLMAADACVKCNGLHTVFNHASVGLWPATENSIKDFMAKYTPEQRAQSEKIMERMHSEWQAVHVVTGPEPTPEQKAENEKILGVLKDWENGKSS